MQTPGTSQPAGRGVTVEKITDTISYNGTTLPFPADATDIEQAKRFYSARYPDIATATVSGPVVIGSKRVHTLTTQLGSKG
jgi:PRTRC genetic system protein C